MRSLEDHLSPRELATLPSSPEGLAESTLDIAQHLIECDACAQLAQTHWSLRNMGHLLSGNQPACPPEDVWLEYAAGLIPERANELLAHAARCADCAHALREAMELMEPEAAELPQELASATPAWQHSLAERMAASAPKPFLVKTTRRVRPWVVFGAAAAVLIATVFTGVTLYRNAHSDTRLLALAYDKHRLSELRIPGSLDSPLASPTRGHNPYADTSSSELFEVKLRAQQAFERNPNDPVLRQTLGRIAIVEHDGETARRQFEMAEALNPNLPNLKFDLATAYFVLAESGNKPLDYARAIDLFGQHLALVHQQDPVALFDQGLCWERQNIDSQAIKDYEAALALEKDPGWRKEIGQHLQALKARDTPTGVSALKPDELTPASFLALTSETPGEYELYLDAASRLWLPHRSDPNPPPGTDAALHQLAAMGLRHGDAWLTDMLKQPATSAEIAAETTLAQALQASAKGNADQALAASASAIKLFEKSGGHPGGLRARAEHVYSLQLLGQGKDCLAEVLPLGADGELALYSWLHAYLQLEQSACHAHQGEVSEALKNAGNAERFARSNQLFKSDLRASVFIIAHEWEDGYLEAAWNSASSTLQKCGPGAACGTYVYQTFYQMDRITRDLHLPWTRVGIEDASSLAAISTGNIKATAYAFEGLGLAQVEIGSNKEASQSFATADQWLSRLGKGTATTRYLVEWQSDRAVLQAREHGPNDALRTLLAQEPESERLDAFLVRSRFYGECAELLRESHRIGASSEYAQKAVDYAERMLPTITTEQERRAWIEMSEKAYSVLTLNLADTDKRAEALRSWEWFHSGPFRGDNGRLSLEHVAATKQASNTISGTLDIEAVLPTISPEQPGVITLVYGRLQDRYIAWSIGSDPRSPIRTRTLDVSANELENQTRAFIRLCADPHSSQQDILILGGSLYKTLIGPFEQQVESAQHIRLDLDSSLTGLPFAALAHDGHFFGLAHQLEFLPPWWVLTQQDRDAPNERAETLPDQAHLLIVRESSPNPVARIPEEYDESPDIASLFPLAQIQPASLHRTVTGLTFYGPQSLVPALASADLIHYSGHGLDESGDQPPVGAAVPTAVAISPGTLKHCRLAVLSACRTLNTRVERELAPDDVPSFERIVLASGATHVVGTQWDVDSAMTRKLMVRFYTELAKHQPFAEALRRAQLSLQSEPTTAHPYFWSAFQLVGQ